MKWFIVIFVLITVLIAGCTQTTPLTWVCPNGIEVIGDPNQNCQNC